MRLCLSGLVTYSCSAVSWGSNHQFTIKYEVKEIDSTFSLLSVSIIRVAVFRTTQESCSCFLSVWIFKAWIRVSSQEAVASPLPVLALQYRARDFPSSYGGSHPSQAQPCCIWSCVCHQLAAVTERELKQQVTSLDSVSVAASLVRLWACRWKGHLQGGKCVRSWRTR